MTHKVLEYFSLTKQSIERDANADEIDVIDALKAKVDANKAEAEANAKAKIKLLAKLGITADEAKLLLS